jgi:NAD(P)H dehydrogenase (quinone)
MPTEPGSVNTLIVYASVKGYTQRMAEAHAEGVSAAGGHPTLKTCEEVSKEDLAACDALILGTPIHMGGMDWRMKRFVDTVCAPLWQKGVMTGKAGGVFASGGGYGDAGGGIELCMLGMFSNLAQLGVVMVPLPPETPGFAHGGTAWGPYVRSQAASKAYLAPDELPLTASRSHGRNIATLAECLRQQRIFAH